MVHKYLIEKYWFASIYDCKSHCIIMFNNYVIISNCANTAVDGCGSNTLVPQIGWQSAQRLVLHRCVKVRKYASWCWSGGAGEATTASGLNRLCDLTAKWNGQYAPVAAARRGYYWCLGRVVGNWQKRAAVTKHICFAGPSRRSTRSIEKYE